MWMRRGFSKSRNDLGTIDAAIRLPLLSAGARKRAPAESSARCCRRQGGCAPQRAKPSGDSGASRRGTRPASLPNSRNRAAGFLGLQGLFTAHVTGNFVTLGAALVFGAHGVLAKLLALPEFALVVAPTRLAGAALAAQRWPAVRLLLIVKVVAAQTLDRQAYPRSAQPLPKPAKDWENLNRKALAFLRLASIRLMLRKLRNPV
jgi:hypothetical protein